MTKLPSAWRPDQPGTVTAVAASTRVTATGDTRVTAAGDTRVTGTILITPKLPAVWTVS